MILMYIFFHQECQNNQMINTLDNSITPRNPRDAKFQLPQSDGTKYSRSSPANAEQTEKLLENQEKERLAGGGESDPWKKENKSREGPPKLGEREVIEILMLTATAE